MRASSHKITAVVLAGGFGTRIQHLLQNLPKPMAPVAGRPFLDWVVRYVARQGVQRVILSTGYLAETVERYFQANAVDGISVSCVPETTPLGTAGGFLNAAAAETGNPGGWLVLNGDSLALAPLDPLFETLVNPDLDGAILGVAMQDASRYGTLIQNEAGELKGFGEKRPGSGIINAGVYLFRSSLLETWPKSRPLSFETDVFPMLAARQVRLKVCLTDAPFLDIGTPESLPQAENFVGENRAFF